MPSRGELVSRSAPGRNMSRDVEARSAHTEPASSTAPAGSAGALARLMAVYIVVVVGKIGDVIPGMHQVPLAKIIAALAIIVAIRNKALLAPVDVWAIAPARQTILFMGLVTLSIFFSVLRSGTLGVIMGTALATLVAQALIVKAARNWAAVRVMLYGAVVAAVVLAATVMSTHVADSTGLRAGYSVSYDPNDFAFVLVGLWPIVVSFFLVSRGWARLGYAGAALWVSVAILLTQSRGGFLGLLADGVLMALLLPSVQGGTVEFRLSRSRVALRIVLLLICGVVAWQFVPDEVRTRLATVSTLGSDYNATRGGRLEIWSRTLPLAASRPWGYGAGAFETADGMFAGGRYRAPHNMFLQALVELGVLGLGLFVAVLATALMYLRVAGPADGSRPAVEAQLFARAVGLSLVGLCVPGFFLSQLYSSILWTQVALVCAVGCIRRLPHRTTSSDAAPAPAANARRADRSS